MSGVRRSTRSLFCHILDAALHIGPAEVRVGHVDGDLPLVKEYRPYLELPAIAHWKPYAILEFLVTHGKTQALDIGAEQRFDGQRNPDGKAGVHKDGLKLGGVDQRLALP